MAFLFPKNYEVLKNYFGSPRDQNRIYDALVRYFGAINKKGLIPQLFEDWDTITEKWEEDSSQNVKEQLLLIAYKNGHVDLFNQYTSAELNDIKIVGNEIHFNIIREDLAVLYEDEDTVENYLNDERDQDFHHFDVNDFESDCVDSLTDVSKQGVKEKVLESVGITVTDSEDIFTEYCEQDGTDGEFELTEERIEEIFTNNSNLAALLETDEFDTLKNNMEFSYCEADGMVIEGEIYDAILGQLEKFLGDRGKWGSDDGFYINVTSTYHKHLTAFIENGQTSMEYNDSCLWYQGSFINVLKELQDQLTTYRKLSFRWPDYASDYKLRDQFYNENVVDRIKYD